MEGRIALEELLARFPEYRVDHERTERYVTDFVQGFRAAGGTALGDVLRDIRGLPEAEGRVRAVVLITDGLPTVGETEPAKILGFAKEAGGKGLRIFTFGVGRDVDPSLLRGVSRASRGRAEIVGPEAQLQFWSRLSSGPFH